MTRRSPSAAASFALWGARAPARRSWSRVVVALALIGATLTAARFLLVVQPSPTKDAPLGFVFVSDLPLPPVERFGVGLDVRIDVRPGLGGDCNPVSVEVVLDTQRLVTGRRTFPVTPPNRFALAVTGDASVRSVRASSLAPGAPVPQLHLDPAVRRSKTTAGLADLPSALVTGTVIAWPTFPYYERPVLRFEADWAERRGTGSCFVRLPALVGTRSVGVTAIAGDQALRGAARRSLANEGARAGATRVLSPGGEVSLNPQDTQPIPDDLSATRWTCRVDRGQSRVNRGAVGDYAPVLATPAGGRDCSARTVVTRVDLQRLSVFASFVLAALFGLGLQLLYEGLTRRR